jgi:hypothetical protein
MSAASDYAYFKIRAAQSENARFEATESCSRVVHAKLAAAYELLTMVRPEALAAAGAGSRPPVESFAALIISEATSGRGLAVGADEEGAAI